MVLIAPFDSITAIGQRHYPFIPVRLVMGNRYDSLGRARGIRVPLLMVTAERDTIIPAAHSARLFEAWGGPKQAVVIPGAGHNDLQESPLFWSAIGGFLAGLR
jgi:hypothetical protein